MSDPEFDLVEKAKAGDKKAFSKLVEKYHKMVFVLAYGILNQRESALDVVQDVFMKAFQEIAHFEGKSSFKTWIYRIAVNRAIDYQRRIRPSVSIDATREEDDAPVIVLPDLKISPRQEAAQSELKDLMQTALLELTPEHRTILVMREWHELSYEEIAEALEVSVGTVMSRLFYARKKLAEALKGKMGEVR